MKFKTEFYATDEGGETYLVDSVGNVLNKKALRKSKLVCGVGVNDWRYTVRSGEGGDSPVYRAWKSMLKRGYDEKVKSRYPTYEGVSVSEAWLTFSTFFNDTKMYMEKWWHLDKDLLFFDNKEYSKDACIFVPAWLNTMFLDCGSARGDLPQGVSWNKENGKFHTRCRVDGKLKHCGYFSTVEEASDAYINFKLNYIESKRFEIEAIALHNDLHLRFGSDFNLTDRVIDNFKKQVS